MKFVVSNWGSRGDIEPCVALGRELHRRGHHVRIAVPPDLVDFAESAGVAAVAYGLDWSATMQAVRPFWTSLRRNPWKIQDLIRFGRESWELGARCWEEMSTTLASLADGADVLISGQSFEPLVSNVAERYDIPMATLHFSPARPRRHHLMAQLQAWEYWLLTKKVEGAQRRALGLPEATRPWTLRIAERGSLEIQAYDEVCFPGLAAEWAKWDGQRPFVGALTLQLATDTDDEVASWVAAGSPPIYFGFGSPAVASAADTLRMIGEACAQLGERGLVCAGGTDFTDLPRFEHIKVVSAVNHTAIFPACRAVVHHGGAGTTAAGLRAGCPTLILWNLPAQAPWAAQVEQLKVGTGRRISHTNEKSLVADLRTILDPECRAHARELATRMSEPPKNAVAAADLVEDFARPKRVG
ncbi:MULTISPECIES: glycosyltransferase [unclassified Mycobacterium]|uniref:glycosyltransferase n=1 Tax=unclassified Mycobacterium TaxID=2642494 RepID=UPI0007FC3ED6|nr:MULTISPECIES: glycosyltransferase [unclassified Mycobacterium]OBH02062.1 glycosyl transferase family 1 [Mycobacterium sp. E2699]OBI49205.1 glycosyl transferase family 1 [Mycobacterium sp. E787]